MCHNEVRMKRLTVLILFTFLGSGYLFAQTPDLAGSYYHFSLAKMHESRQEYREAISEFEKAIPLDPTSGALRVEFAETLWEAGENRRAVEECQEAIRECQDETTFNEKFGCNLKKGKWKRRGAILGSIATYKECEVLPQRAQTVAKTSRLIPGKK